MRGTVCPRCGKAILIVVNTKLTADGRHRIRYIGCRGCGFRPENNKEVVPIVNARPAGRSIVNARPGGSRSRGSATSSNQEASQGVIPA